MSLVALLLCGGLTFGSIIAAASKLPRAAAAALTFAPVVGAIIFLEWAAQ